MGEAKEETIQAIRVRANKIAIEAPPLSNAQIVRLRAIFGHANRRLAK
ncbi:hypothetical protein [Rhodococcus sp. IEGM 1302]|nr:hypothetical protein [Rhodococcus sp. IEGM 1302]MDI9947414.1 hypothetical protein [Rhodococcus sp. IEGM 1302]